MPVYPGAQRSQFWVIWRDFSGLGGNAADSRVYLRGMSLRGLEAAEFLLVLHELTGDAAFIAAEPFERILLQVPGASLGGDALHGNIFRRAFALSGPGCLAVGGGE